MMMMMMVIILKISSLSSVTAGRRDGGKEGRTYGWTDKASYRDA